MMFIGTVAGIIIGAIPGLTATMGVAVLLPVTFGMDPARGMLFLLGIYVGGIYAGSVSGILINTPGTPAAAATVIDGHALAKKGRAADALRADIWGSTVGGLVSGLILLFFAPIVARAALRFGPPEYFALAVFGLSIISVAASRDMIKGLIAASIGLLIASMGLDPIEAMPRFTFGIERLDAGIPLIPALIGLFAIPEILRRVQIPKVDFETAQEVKEGTFGWRDAIRYWKTMLRGGLIGAFIGAIPGTGSAIAAFLSYNEAKRSSKEPEKYGKGEIDGVIAAEAGNNGVTGSTLIPLLTLGIPGDTVTAVLLGALMIHGLDPGPLLFERNAEYVYTVMVGFIAINVIMFVVAHSVHKLYEKILFVPQKYLWPIILIFCVAGAYAVNNTVFDIFLMLFFGVVGYLLSKFDFSVTPLLLALILGPMAEKALRQSLIMSRGNPAILFTRPIAAAFLGLAVIMALYPLIRPMIRRGS